LARYPSYPSRSASSTALSPSRRLLGVEPTGLSLGIRRVELLLKMALLCAGLEQTKSGAGLGEPTSGNPGLLGAKGLLQRPLILGLLNVASRDGQ
jgi:hypothetical protein